MKIKQVKKYNEAKALAERIFVVNLPENGSFLDDRDAVAEQTGYGNFLSATAGGCLRAKGWYSARVDDVKTLFTI